MDCTEGHGTGSDCRTDGSEAIRTEVNHIAGLNSYYGFRNHDKEDCAADRSDFTQLIGMYCSRTIHYCLVSYEFVN